VEGEEAEEEEVPVGDSPERREVRQGVNRGICPTETD